MWLCRAAVRMFPTPAFKLKKDGDGMPLLPDITELKLEAKKAIVRAFLTSHYRESIIATSENLLNAWTQGSVLGLTRQSCHGAPSYKVRMTLWQESIFRRMWT